MSWEIKLDGNKAIDQMTELAGKAWNAMSEPSTAVVIELMNETKYHFRHVGDYRWQGNFMEPRDDVEAGYGSVWGMESKGMDGSFGMVTFELWEKDKGTGVYLVLGNLVYWDGAQPEYTVLINKTNYYNEGKPNCLVLLNQNGKSASWNFTYDELNLRAKVDIWREKITSTEENFRIQITPDK